MHFVSRLQSALRYKVRSTTNDPEAAREDAASYEELDLSLLELPVEVTQSHGIQCDAVQWIIETSTDMGNIAAAAGMVPEIEWTAAKGVTDILDRLGNHFYACFDPTDHILPLAQARAVACLKAIRHCSVERGQSDIFYFTRRGTIHFKNFVKMAPDQTYLVVLCTVGYPVELNMKSLPLSDKMWMAHMFTYRLHRGDNGSGFVSLLIEFINTSLDPKSPTRLVADCVLLAGMLLGLQVDGRHLARLDKR